MVGAPPDVCWRSLSIAVKGLGKGDPVRYDGIDFIDSKSAEDAKLESWSADLVEVSEPQSLFTLADAAKKRFKDSVVYSSSKSADINMICAVLRTLDAVAVMLPLATDGDTFLSNDTTLPLPVLCVSKQFACGVADCLKKNKDTRIRVAIGAPRAFTDDDAEPASELHSFRVEKFMYKQGRAIVIFKRSQDLDLIWNRCEEGSDGRWTLELGNRTTVYVEAHQKNYKGLFLS